MREKVFKIEISEKISQKFMTSKKLGNIEKLGNKKNSKKLGNIEKLGNKKTFNWYTHSFTYFGAHFFFGKRDGVAALGGPDISPD